MTPAISVILPARDAAATLSCALDSVRAQTPRDIEILVIDDGSRDATPEIARRAARRDARVRLIDGRGRGIVSALNAGLAGARARYVARMDADDISLPGRLGAQRAFLDARREVGLVGCRVAFGGDPVASRGYALHVAWTNGLLEPDAIGLHRFIESPFAHPSVMFRRELIALHGGYRDGRFPEDYELWLRWLEAGVLMAKVPATLLVWNDRADRLSRADPRYSKEAFFRLKAEYLARWLARHNPRHPEITTWGAGRLARRRAEMLLPHGIRIARHADIDPRLVGRFAAGRPVVGPDDIPKEDFVVAFVAARGARDLIRARLQSQGRTLGRDFMLAA